LKEVGENAVVVIDEAFWSAGLCGTDELRPIQLPLARLRSTETPNCSRADNALIVDYRQRALRAIEARDAGGLMRSAFEREGITAAGAEEWSKLEWSLKP
jgi:hypothetical protein